MPKMEQTPTATATPPKPAATPAKKPGANGKKPKIIEQKELLYPEPSVKLCVGADALTEEQVTELLKWETEEHYRVRMSGGKPAIDKTIGFGDNYLLKDAAGKKVMCWNNTQNRPFKEPWAKALAQTILKSGPGLPKKRRQWRWNGESASIGQYGQILSAQHRFVGFKLACEMWRRDQKKYLEVWPECPTLELVISFGVEEDQETISTLDNVEPRSLSDVFYTSELYKNLDATDRRECSRMLEKALGVVWRRTRVKKDKETGAKYQTHQESMDFLDRHPKLLYCVKHLFTENAERAITNRQLSPGTCAGLMYLFGCSTSDLEEYKASRVELALSWDNEEKARELFVLLSCGGKEVADVIKKLGDLVDPDTLGGGRLIEKNAVLVKAFNLYVEDKKITEDDLELAYGEDTNGNMKLLEYPTCGGIDQGDQDEPQEGDKNVPTEEQIEAAKKAEREKRAQEMAEKVKAKNVAKRAAQGQ